MIDLGVQMFTLRRYTQTEAELVPALAQLHEIGYSGLGLWRYPGAAHGAALSGVGDQCAGNAHALAEIADRPCQGHRGAPCSGL